MRVGEERGLVDTRVVVPIMAVYRVAGKGVDAVLTMNVPFVDQTQLDEAKEVFNVAARSLAIVDYSLFA